MPKRIIIGLIVLLLIAAAVTWAVIRNNKKDEQGVHPLLSVYAYNQTRKAPAIQIAAEAKDVIAYTLTVENQTDKIVSGYIVEANIAEVTDKSTLIDANGASYNSATNSLVWTPLDIPANAVIQKQLSVRVNPLPIGSAGSVMKIKFNNELAISIKATAPVKQVAGTTNTNPFNAPATGPVGDLSLWLASIATASVAIVKRYRITKT